MRSAKEHAIDNKILDAVEKLFPEGNLSPDGVRRHVPGGSKTARAAKLLLEDEEVQALQEYANNVSIVRLGYNDHGPVHMRTVTLNTLIMMGILRRAGIKMSLEAEDYGTFEDSVTAALCAAMLHDLGMSIGRQDHELHSSYLASPILDRVLRQVYGGDIGKVATVRSLALEGISGHMGNRQIHSLEAGVILVADGCDMTKGRARIPMSLIEHSRVGDIHKYSANSIEELRLGEGTEKPIRIEALMSSEVGLFQIEEVLLGKIAASTIKGHIELYAQVRDEERKRYM